jgi:hypothetical protein
VGQKEAFDALQDKVAENAGELVRLQLSSLKELIDTLMKLDAIKHEVEDDTGNEQRLQAFLRKSDDPAESVQ